IKHHKMYEGNMQERVGFAPPEIKIFEGKPPPYSWVAQNIVKYYQLQSQIAFLTDILTYAQGLQSEQMEKARTRALDLKESFAALPESPNPTNISNVTVYNTLQGYVKTQIEYLEKMAVLLKQSDPQLADQMNLLLGQLKNISSSFPKVSEE